MPLLQMIQVPNPPKIDQVFVAALNRNAPAPYPEHLEAKTRYLLQAAYHGTYLAALHQKSETLYLTMVGGGSFRNPPQLIIEAITQAHVKWTSHPAAYNLKRVVLVLYTKGGGTVVNAMSQALAKQNIPSSCIQINRCRGGKEGI